MLVGTNRLQRVGAGVLLKSIGSGFRVADFWEASPRLRDKVVMREATLLGFVTAASYLLEIGFERVKPLLEKNPAFRRAGMLVQFVPTALAFVLAEMASRKISSFSEALQDEVGLGENTKHGTTSHVAVLNPQRPPRLAAIQDKDHDDDDDDHKPGRGPGPLHAGPAVHPAPLPAAPAAYIPQVAPPPQFRNNFTPAFGTPVYRPNYYY